jgi:hypothetical protein
VLADQVRPIVDILGSIMPANERGKRSVAGAGSKEAKQNLRTSVKSGKDTPESVEYGPTDVKVLGSVAVVQGSDTEESVTNGKDSSGKYVWMHVFVKRDGKWVAVRSESTMVK